MENSFKTSFMNALMLRDPPQLPVGRQRRELRRSAVLAPCHDIPLGFKLMHDGHGHVHECWLCHPASDEKSLITFAPSRSGKSRDQLVAEAVSYGGMINGIAPSVVFNDKKPELLPIVARARHLLGDDVYKLDAFGAAPPSPYVKDASINPIYGLTPYDRSRLTNISYGLVLKEGTQPHFAHRARQLCTTLFGHFVDDNEAPADIPHLMDVLGLSDRAFVAYMKRLATESPIDWVRRGAAPFTSLRGADEKESIKSTLAGQLEFLNDINVRRMLSGKPSLNLRDLKNGGIALFIIVGEEQETLGFAALSRLLWTLTINELYRPPFTPILLLIDEAANSLTETSALIENAFSLGGGFGLRFHLTFQSKKQFDNLFRDNADSVLSAASTQQWFRPNDMTSAKFLQERVGNVTRFFEEFTFSSGVSTGPDGKSSSNSGMSRQFKPYDRPRWTVQELHELPPDRQLLFFEGVGAPVIAFRKPYYRTGWANRCDANPFVPGS